MGVKSTALRGQMPDSGSKPLKKPDKKHELSMADLEAVCMELLDAEFGDNHRDVERQYWQRRFKNIVTPVSLALSECEGGPRFHQHYRHSESDDSVLVPVVADPVAQLKLACETALLRCEEEMVGIEDKMILKRKALLEKALRGFLKHCG